MLHVFETYAIQNGGFCREWFRAQAYVKASVGALHRGIGKTKQDANKEVVYNRENRGVVDRRDIDWEENGKKTAVEKYKQWMKHNTCKERSYGKDIKQTLAESREGFERHDMCRER